MQYLIHDVHYPNYDHFVPWSRNEIHWKKISAFNLPSSKLINSVFQAFDRVRPFSQFNRVHSKKSSKNIRHLDSLQRLPDLFRRAHELHLIPSEVLNCLPPLPSMSDLHKLKDDFKTSLPSLSGWNLAELLTNCLPEQFSLVNQTDHNVVLSVKSFSCPQHHSM